MFRKLGLFPSSGEGKETPALLGPLERANLSPDTVIEVSPFLGTQQSPSPHLKTETDPVSETFCLIVIYDSRRWTSVIHHRQKLQILRVFKNFIC
jgi:hypothetical protein